MKKMKTGIIGCGNISGIYFSNAKRFGVLDLAACADLDVAKAREKGREHGVKGCSVDELLADPEIGMVINLTIPQAHSGVCLQALEAGKHVYVEKPLAVTREEGMRVMETAGSRGLRVGCAPDTFLGGGIQTCIKLIDDGELGEIVGAAAFMVCGGHESWHPAPEFYYKAGGGPMFDMGPYYLTALAAMLGPIRRVTGSARMSFGERTITSQPKAGTAIAVEVPTHIAGVMDFHSGAVGTILTSFDVFGRSTLPRIEVYGSKGTLLVPDPNTFGGPVLLARKGAGAAEEIALSHGFADNCRGLGAADMAQAILSGRPHRASGEMAYHVLEAMHGFHDASSDGRHYVMRSTCAKPAPLRVGPSPDIDPE